MNKKNNIRNIYLKILKLVFYPIFIIIFLILLYVLCAFLFSRITVNPVENTNLHEIDIYLISNGFHSDIVVPIESKEMDWSEIIKYEHTLSNDSSYNFIAFGWGDRKFYLETPTWSHLKYDVAFQALFFLNQSAIHATFFREMYESESCIKISLSSQDYRKLAVYIIGELMIDENGKVLQIKNLQYDDNDAFYEAKGSFTLFYTCNTWVNDALKSANQKACLWTPFEEGILYQYQE